ncbi:MAG: DUF4347 domain-containing protein [Cyanobacteria bacterium P01_F01_bin.150]
MFETSNICSVQLCGSDVVGSDSALLHSINQSTGSELVVIDTRVDQYQQLINGLNPGTQVLLVNAAVDGVSQITQALSVSLATTLHVVCHGEPGVLFLGSKPLTQDNLSIYRHQLQEWGVTDILLYSCEVAVKPQLLYELHQLTGANIAASQRRVGSPSRGGTWSLETHIGDVSAAIAFSPAVQHTYPGVFHGLQFYIGLNESGQVQSYLGRIDNPNGGYSNIFSDDYLTLAPVGVWDDRVVEERDTAFDYHYTDNASYFPGFTPQPTLFYDTPVDGSDPDESFDPEQNTYFQVNFLDQLKVWNGNEFVPTGGEVMTWNQESWLVNDAGEWYVEFTNSVTTGEGPVSGEPYYYAVYNEVGSDHWHYVMELQEGSSPTGIDNGLYLLPISVETNIPNSQASDPVYILYNQGLSPAPDADQATILAAQNYLLDTVGQTQPAQEFKAFLDSEQNGVDSDATGVATFSLNPEQTELTYTIQLDGLDLVEDPTARTADNAVTKIHFHHRDYGTNGSHVLNIFGAPSVDDDDIVIDYDNATITGKWDWDDAAANFIRNAEPKSDGVYGDWTAPELDIEAVSDYANGTLSLKLKNGEPSEELNIFEGTLLSFGDGVVVEVTENITLSQTESQVAQVNLVEGDAIASGDIAVLPTAQMPGTKPLTTSLINLFHGNLYVQVHTNQNPTPGDIRGQILPIRTIADADEGVMPGGIGNDLFELDAATAAGVTINDAAGVDTLTFTGVELTPDNLQQEGNSLVIDINQDGQFSPADDVTVQHFFGATAMEPGSGFIERINGWSGDQLLDTLNVTDSDVYYFWVNADTNTHGVTVASSDDNGYTLVAEFTIDALSTITAPEAEGGNGQGASWGDAVVSKDGSRVFVNARNADQVVVIDTATRSVETILDVGDRPVHSFIYEDEVWVHVDGDGGFNIIDQNTLEVSELIAANTVGTGHGKLLLSETLGVNIYATNTAEPAVFPINLETREVGDPVIIGGGDPELGTHDKGYDPATGLAFFQLTDSAGFSFVDAATNEVVFDQVPILGRITQTPDDDFILILNAAAETDDVGIWNTTLDTHTQPEFDATVTIGGGISVNGTDFYLDGDDWEAWIPQTIGDNVAVLNLTTNTVDLIEVGDLTVPEGARHFSRRGDSDTDFFFTYSDEGGVRIDLDSYEVSGAIALGGSISRMAVVEMAVPSNSPDATHLDFEMGHDGPMVAGDVVSDQMEGLTISAAGELEAMIFDSANPTGGDSDLAHDTLGNILIISEDGDSTDPDDNARGGTLMFDWDGVVNVESIGLLDIEEAGGTITLYGADDTIVLATIDMVGLGDNSVQSLNIATADVGKMDVLLGGSGAITEIILGDGEAVI